MKLTKNYIKQRSQDQKNILRQTEAYINKRMCPPKPPTPNIPIHPIGDPVQAVFICHDCNHKFKVDAGTSLKDRVLAQRNPICTNCMGQRSVMMCLVPTDKTEFV